MMIFNGYTKRDFSKCNNYIINMAHNIIKNLDVTKDVITLDLPFPNRWRGEQLMCALSCLYFPYETTRADGGYDDFMCIGKKKGRIILYPKRIKELLDINNRIDNKLYSIIVSLRLDNLNDYDKCIVIHNYVCNKLHYCQHTNSLGGYDHLFIKFSRLLDGDCTVCNGYARLFSALCEKAGIDCVNVCNDNHEWNRIIIDEEKFFVDCTWDDGNEVKWKWCMKTKKEFYSDLGHPKSTKVCSYWRM